MADTKITGLGAATTIDLDNDLLEIVDVSDTSMDAGGTNKKVTPRQVVGTSTDNPVTGAATASLSLNLANLVWNVCSGTSADYTLSLPAVSGNANKYCAIRMAAGLTKLVTVDGNSSETIDGATTRIMWAQESAVLLCDGSTWTKITGKSRPMTALVYRNAAQSIASATIVKIGIDTASVNQGGMANTGSSRIDILRPATYEVSCALSYAGGIAAAQYVQTRIHKDGDPTNSIALQIMTVSAAGTANSPSLYTSVLSDNVAGGYYELYTYQSTGSNAALFVSEPVSWLAVKEVNPW